MRCNILALPTLQPFWASAVPRAFVYAKEVSRVLVCTGHLCECQGEGAGARALLKDLRKADVEVQETPCLSMCGMGAMGCVEYCDGSETLTHGREQMLDELGIAKDFAADCSVGVKPRVSNIRVCTGRMCNREEHGGEALLEALRQEVSEPELLEASPCLGACGKGSLVCVEYEDGCEETVAGLRATLETLASGVSGRQKSDVPSARGGTIAIRTSSDAPGGGYEVLDQYESLSESLMDGRVPDVNAPSLY